PSMFNVGGNLALTPGKVVFQNELMQLIQYKATTKEVLKTPLLIIPPWINKFYILDLTPDKSFIKWCVDQGTTVFMVSWVNTYAGDLMVFVDEERIKHLESHMKEQGYLEASRMANTFNMLRSNDLIWPYIVNNYMRGKKPLPFDVLYWNSDATRMPAANHSFYLRNCYLDNKLTKGEMEIDGVSLDLHKVKAPIYNLATREDHIAPAKSVMWGSQYFGGPVKYVVAG